MGIVYQKDKRSGITYAYESKSRWDKEKQQSRATRRLIGRVDEVTGEIKPTDGRRRKKQERDAKQEQLPLDKRSFYGATYLLDALGERLGLIEDLKACFPDTYKQIQSIAYYLIMEDRNPLIRFEKWSSVHKHPYGQNISSQRSSDLFASISEDQKNAFLKRWGKRRVDKEYWAYDTTSISSYSEVLKQVKYGHNKDDDKLPQINLAVLSGEQSGLPFYYRKLAGNIPDVKTVSNLLADAKNLGFDRVRFLMDRGFFSRENINSLYHKHIKFLMAGRISSSFIKAELDKVYGTFEDYSHLDEAHEVYATTVTTWWDYSQKRPYKGDELSEKRRMYIHLYYNIDRAVEDKKKLDKRIMNLKRELESGQQNPEHEKQYAKYFDIKSTPKRGVKAIVKQDVVNAAKRYYGYFALIGNQKMDSIFALQLYRNKDIAEQTINGIKDRLNMKRTLVSSEKSLDGKLFVEFIALIYISHLKKLMQDKELFKSYTLTGLLDKLDVIECFESPGHKLRFGETLEAQRQLFEVLGVDVPGSL